MPFQSRAEVERPRPVLITEASRRGGIDGGDDVFRRVTYGIAYPAASLSGSTDGMCAHVEIPQRFRVFSAV